MDYIGTPQIAEALMRSYVLADKKIAAIKILRDASRNTHGVAVLGLKEAKEYIDAAAEKIAFDAVVRNREVLADRLVQAASTGDTSLVMEAARELRGHVEDHGRILLNAKHNPF